MFNKILDTAKSVVETTIDCAVARAQTIADEEVKQAWKQKAARVKQIKQIAKKEIKLAEQQFSLTVKDVFDQHLKERKTKRSNEKANVKSLKAAIHNKRNNKAKATA